MRYMLIMQVEPEAAARAAEELDIEQIVRGDGRLQRGAAEGRGLPLRRGPLRRRATASASTSRRSRPVVTDGPFAEAREVFTGFWILEVAGREEAELWARKCPLGPGRRPRGAAGQRDRATSELPADNEWLVKEQEWRAANA